MQIHDIKSTTKRASKKRVGRGGSRGRQSGKGHKGQKARAGGTPRAEIRDVVKKIPKKRGYNAPQVRTQAQTVTLTMLNREFEDGAEVNIKALLASSIVPRGKNIIPRVKIVSTGELSKKLTITECKASPAAVKAIEAAGGTITIPVKQVVEKSVRQAQDKKKAAPKTEEKAK